MSYEAHRVARERHVQTVERKRQRILMYNALIDAWEMREDRDDEYLKELRRKLHMAECQLKNMKDW